MVNLMVNKDENLDLVFSALAHPVRREMLARLSQGTATVGELAKPHAMSAPAISKHLRVLERAGLIGRSAEGRIHRVNLEREPLGDARAWLTRHVEIWESSLDRLVGVIDGISESKEE